MPPALVSLVFPESPAPPRTGGALGTALRRYADAFGVSKGKIKLTAVPRGVWQRFFHVVVLERETGLEPSTSSLEAKGSCLSSGGQKMGIGSLDSRF